MNRNVLVSTLVALIVGVVAGVLAVSTRGSDNVTFTLKDVNGRCAYDLKQDGFVVHGNNLQFRYYSTCSSEPQVAIGNVRTASETSSRNCDNATESGTPWPFKDADADIAKRQATLRNGRGSFTLHGARNAGSYYFSVCLGSEVVDPRLVIE